MLFHLKYFFQCNVEKTFRFLLEENFFLSINFLTNREKEREFEGGERKRESLREGGGRNGKKEGRGGSKTSSTFPKKKFCCSSPFEWPNFFVHVAAVRLEE